MTRKRSIHEVAFRLNHDMALQIAPEVAKMDVGLTAQQLRTMRLIWASENVTMMEIADTLKRNKAQVVRLVDELCKAGMVVRRPNPNDGRSKILSLTEQGAGFFHKIEAIEDRFASKLTDGIADEDLQAFFRVADQLSANLKAL